ncbi:hypothetical protein KBC99_01840 [Candidatus Saccharibacteria bacterium]|nr:hypothetical protein [Candidatus Saccharibacteria bacterium]
MTDSEMKKSRVDDLLIDARLVSPIIIIICVAILLDFFHGGTFSKNFWAVSLTTILTTLFALTHFIPRLGFSKRHLIYLVLYHMILSVYLVFIVKTPSYYMLLWIPLTYLSEYYYLARGLLLSLMSLFLVMLLATAYQYHGFTLDSAINLVPYFVILTAVIMIFNRLILGTRQQRISLSDKIIHAEYEHQRMIALINSMSEAVIAVNQDGHVSVYNAAAMELLNTNVSLSDKNISDILHITDLNHKPIDIMSLAEETEFVTSRSDIILPVDEHDALRLEINISRISLASTLNSQQGFTFLLRDITEAMSIKEAKDIFISEVSHELRTPITVSEANISMAQVVAKKAPLDLPKLNEQLDKAHHQVLTLANMINDLSTLSRVERPDKDMDVTTFAVSEIITEQLNAHKPQAERKGLHLFVEADKILPQITTSRLYITEILQNLITNAIKYTETGSVTILAHLENEKTLFLGVRDTGIGIAKAEQDKVFQKFWRSEDPYTRQNNGTGLGLYITKQLAQRIGADLTFQTKLKVGSIFLLKLPIVAVKEVDQANLVENEVKHLLD